MLERIFSLSQRVNETSYQFVARVGLRVLFVVFGLGSIAYLNFKFLFPILVHLPSTVTPFIAGFLLISSILAFGVALLGGSITFCQVAWRIAVGHHQQLEIVPNILTLLFIIILGTFPAYLAICGLISGEIEHLSHRVKEHYQITHNPVGYWVHLSLHLGLSLLMYLFAFKIAVVLKQRYRALTNKSGISRFELNEKPAFLAKRQSDSL